MSVHCAHGIPEYICLTCTPNELFIDDEWRPVFTCAKCGTRTPYIEAHLSESHMGPRDSRWGWIIVAAVIVMVVIAVIWRINR